MARIKLTKKQIKVFDTIKRLLKGREKVTLALIAQHCGMKNRFTVSRYVLLLIKLGLLERKNGELELNSISRPGVVASR